MSEIKHKVTFQKYKCVIEKLEYNNGRTALELVSIKNGEPILMATVNLPDEIIASDEVIIKNYSENEGVLNVLMLNGIVGTIERYADNNSMFPICKLLI